MSDQASSQILLIPLHHTLNGKKCHILHGSIGYLGFTLTGEGFQAQTKKIQVTQLIAVPKNRKQRGRFLGMIDVVPNKAALCTPLNRFTSNMVPLSWLQSYTDTFNAIAEVAILAFPDFEQPFHVYVDASGK
ncbi:hypothetical protein PC113_g16318 [Phytophthora cactorum]|uniref:Reverse transcriptase/retrotransposon-derived protein RNase H-like domain-containing protein n=1 Tax=Phytophthora cactorum TaxID=29920 RepID=A0A8T0YSD1_9STRA|nr:hypothetical protein PC113_g16318 [Phytophthora cactorum]